MQQIIPQIIGVLVILGQAFIIMSVIYFLLGRPASKITGYIGAHNLQLAFAVALVAAGGSLYFSEVMHLEPCRLCWFQRIFMYPQAIILGLAWWRQDFSVRPYSLVLSGIGILFSLYHNYILNSNAVTTCSIDAAESCTTVLLKVFGFITIPLMALTAFAMIIVLWFFRNGKQG
jgi:disulfide bond formation protein DsbB